MRTDDFWEDPELPFDDVGHPNLRLDLLRDIRAGQTAGRSDIEIAIALARMLHDEYEGYGTDSSNAMSDADSREATRTLLAVLKRLGIEIFSPPFSDFPTFRRHWNRSGGYGSWQARRDMLHDQFEPLHQELERLEDVSLVGELVAPISPHKKTGWPRVDEEIAELRRHFHAARTEQDYRNVGNDCVTILEALSAVAYHPSKHLQQGEQEPDVAKTKLRLDRVIEVGFPGPSNAELRAFARSTIVLAQAVKHNPTSSRLRAGIAADAVIQLANMLRRIDQATPTTAPV